MLQIYSFTIFDSPNTSPWPTHCDVERRAESAEAVLDHALSIARREGRACGEYRPDDEVYVIVWGPDGRTALRGSVVLGGRAGRNPAVWREADDDAAPSRRAGRGWA